MFSLVERNGSKRSMVVANVTGATLRGAIKEHVAQTATVMTDTYASYAGVILTHNHKTVNHAKGQYVAPDGETHTNTVESSFALLKRGVMGSFHHVSKKHLPLYLAEFDFRWNRRKTTDGERYEEAVKASEGKRMTYKPLTKKAE